MGTCTQIVTESPQILRSFGSTLTLLWPGTPGATLHIFPLWNVLCSGGFHTAVKFPNKLQASNPSAVRRVAAIVAIVMCTVGEDQHQRVRNGRDDQGISHKSPTDLLYPKHPA